jgi:hypothetical protein
MNGSALGRRWRRGNDMNEMSHGNITTLMRVIGGTLRNTMEKNVILNKLAKLSKLIFLFAPEEDAV